ncbi:PREDICTED: uncharacterized protein LOC109163263 [Ipomoea nil]|uniref:uncharacterized protein LOC109163263 n=1 Tax=Ipomoea nil TaxID=35883 RepID=UPI0009010457|nr:PREDICTED: uncharacterized protein LOC109163263 [Ipomoea nil]
MSEEAAHILAYGLPQHVATISTSQQASPLPTFLLPLTLPDVLQASKFIILKAGNMDRELDRITNGQKHRRSTSQPQRLTALTQVRLLVLHFFQVPIIKCFSSGLIVDIVRIFSLQRRPRKTFFYSSNVMILLGRRYAMLDDFLLKPVASHLKF